MRVFVAPTLLGDEDIVVGEGRRIVFVDPAAAAGLDLTAVAAIALPAFLDSDALPEHVRMKLTRVPVPGPGAEDVVVVTHGPDEGAVFTGTEDGNIFRVSHDGRRIDRVAHTGGRPLGLEIDPDGRLLVCDAHRGVLGVDTTTGAIEPVTDSVAGRKMCSATTPRSPPTGPSGSPTPRRRFGIEQWKDDFVQDTRTGRLLRLDHRRHGRRSSSRGSRSPTGSRSPPTRPTSRSPRRPRAPSYAAGSPGPAGASATSSSEDLPGYPDNIARGSDGLIWVTIASPTDPVVERLHRAPLWLRRQVTRIPDGLQPKPKRTVRVQAYDDDGRWCTTSTSTPPTTTWSPASGSTTGGSGSAASGAARRRSRSVD